MKKRAILVLAAALALTACGASESEDQYLEWVHAYSDHMPDLSDDELIDLGGEACAAGEKDASAVGLEPFMMPLFDEYGADMNAEGAMAISYAAISLLCPEVGEEYADPLPAQGEYLGPPE